MAGAPLVMDHDDRDEVTSELVQWLTCAACNVAWVGRWSTDACWNCGGSEHVRLRWAAA